MSLKPGKELIRFYFSFNDPYGFILTPVVKNLGHNYKVDIEYVPLTTYDKSGMFSDDKTTRHFYSADVLRFAKKAGRKLIYSDKPVNSIGLCEGYYHAYDQMLGVKYMNLVLAARWVSAKDTANVEEVVEALKYLEMDQEELTKALSSDKYLERYIEGARKADEDGVIGVPFFTFRGEGYMGADGLGYLEDTLKSDQSLIVHHDAGYEVIKADELTEKIGKGEPLLVLDIRIPKDYGAGHIPGANCIPAKVVHRNLHKLDHDWNIIIVDDGGVAASETAFFLASEGFSKVSVLSDGMPTWKGATETGIDNWHDKLK